MEQEADIDVQDWSGEHWSIIGPSWLGFDKVKYFIVFGASYCQTSVVPQNAPTEEEPLGVPFPGSTYTEGPNWVGHLAKSREPPFLVHNYSRSGQTAEGVRTQVFVEFTQRHPPEIPWTAHDTVFATWVGINDLTVTSDVQPRIDALFEAQQRLYEQGARIFLFVDLFPPAPASNEVEPEYRDRFSRWNVALDRAIRAFSAEKSTAADPITVIYFSSHKVFSAIISNPTAYGFSERDTKKAGGLIWEDRMHPTSAGHLVVAKELNEVLSSIPPCSSQSSD